jgi:hypothetical protein
VPVENEKGQGVTKKPTNLDPYQPTRVTRRVSELEVALGKIAGRRYPEYCDSFAKVCSWYEKVAREALRRPVAVVVDAAKARRKHGP